MADIVNLEQRFIGGGVGTMPYFWEGPNNAMLVIQDVINATWNEAKGNKD